MIKPELLFAVLIAAAVLATPATARQSERTSPRVAANPKAHTATDAYRHACCRNRSGDFRGLAERDVWGHWGAYYGPMIH
jgi:hypothetical protein